MKNKAETKTPTKPVSVPTLEKPPERLEQQGASSPGARATAAAPPPPGGNLAARAAGIMRAPEQRPDAMGRARMMQRMQRSVGNARLSRMLGAPIQAKLTVGAPGDSYEQEADRVADTVMRMPQPQAIGEEKATNEEQRTSIQPPVMRRRVVEQPTTLRAQAMHSQTPQVAPETESHINASKGGGEPLSEPARTFAEPRFGQDFGAVRVHTDTQSDQAARALNAQAFTSGQDIYFGTGHYQPGTKQGDRLLAHELTHVLQQENVGELPVQRNGAGDVPKQPGSEVITHSVGELTLEEYPTEGRALLRYHGWIWAQYLWEAQPGRTLPLVGLGQAEGPIMQLTVKIQAPFRVDVGIAESVEQSIANTVGRRIHLRHMYDFQGGVTTKLRDGSIEREMAPVEIAYEYAPPLMLEAPPPPRKKLPSLTQLTAPQPKTVHKTWTFDTAEKYEAFASSHGDTKWAEILTKDGKHVAFALTVEAATRMAERLRKSDYNFEFLDEYPSGKVISVHLYGKKLPSVEAMGDLYFRDSSSALTGPPNASLECEVFQMEQKRFGRKGLSHQEALTRWRELEKLSPEALATLKTNEGYTFFALHIRGASGLQTIGMTELPAVREELSQKGEFSPTSPVADDLSLPLPANLAYADIVSALQTLYRRKSNIVEGREGPEELDAINGRIELLVGKLRDLGVRRSSTEIFDAIQKGIALNKITGRLVVAPERDNYFIGERLLVSVVLDYLPPGSTLDVAWRWSARGKEFQFFSERERSKSLELRPDDLFWNAIEGNDIGRAMGFEVKAYVYVDGGKTAIVPLRTAWITLVDNLPPGLTIGGPKVIVQGAWADFRIAEWAPIHSHYSLDWYIDGARVVEDLPGLRRKFDAIGTHKMTAKIYQVKRSLGIRAKTLATEVSTDFEVQDMEVAGSKFLEQTSAQTLPSLRQVGSTMGASIKELEKRVAQGGTAATYWKTRLEAEKKRQENLGRLAPGFESFQDLPPDPTAIAGKDTYSGPIPATLVVPEGGVQPLSMYLTVKKEGDQYQARLLDITGADVWKFDGSGKTPLEAYTKAFETWKGDHPYPRGGKVVYRFSPTGWTLGPSFETTRVGNTVKAWVDGLLLVGALVVTGLLLAAPDASITKVLGLMMLAATVARSTVAIVENINLGMAPLDSRNILEAASILTAFMGVGGSALRQVGGGLRTVRPVVYRAGNWLVLATVTADAATLVYVTDAAIEQMRAIQADPTKDEGQKSVDLLRLAATLMMQGTMFIVANKEMFKGPSGLRRSDLFTTDPKAMLREGKWMSAGEVKLEPGARLDVAAELRKAGDDVARITKIPDAELLTRYSMMPWLSATLSEAEMAGMLKRASTGALTGLSELSAKDALRLFERIGNDAVANDLAPLLRGSGLDALVTATGSTKLVDLHGTFGAAGTAKLAGELGAERIGRLVGGQEAITVTELKELSDKLGNGVLKNLANDDTLGLTGKQIEALVIAHGEASVKWAGRELTGKDAQSLLTLLSADATTALQDIGAAKAKAILDAYGKDIVNTAAPTTGGERLDVMRELLGDQAAKKVAAANIGSSKQLAKFVSIGDKLKAMKGVIEARKPLGAQSSVADSNALIAIDKLMNQTKPDGAKLKWSDLEPVERNSINSLRRQRGLPDLTTDPAALDLVSIIGTTDLRAGNVLLGEFGARPGIKVGALDLTVSRNSPEYTGMLKELEKRPMVGKPKGAADRAGVADAVFAKTSGGPAPFQTADAYIYERLAEKYGPPGLTSILPGTPKGDIPPIHERIKVNLKGATGFIAKIPDGTGATHDVLVIPVFP